MTKNEAISYMFKALGNKVKHKMTGKVWVGNHNTSATVVVIDMWQYNQMSEGEYEVVK